MKNMNTIEFKNKGNILMVAHRGVSGLEVENTCPAFVAAGVKSYFGIETDVHVTGDGKYVISHDETLQRVAEVELNVETSDLETIRKVRMKDTDGKTERNDLFPPTLQEYIHICRKYGKVSVLELKNRMNDNNVIEIVNIVKDMGHYEKTIFISFDMDNLRCIRKNFPDANIQFLYGVFNYEVFDFMVENRIDADMYHGWMTAEIVKKIHDAGLKVNVFTVDDLETAEKVKSFGVDFITTDILE